jgi:hypothetical protein
LDYVPVEEAQENVQIKRLLDEIYLKDPCLGSRRLVTILGRDHGMIVNRKRLQRLRREMGIEAIYCKPRTSIVDKAIASIPTYCVIYRSHGPIKCGAPTSPTFPCQKAAPISAR